MAVKKKNKRAKVTAPKMTNTYRPDGMDINKWQIELRRQASQKETFAITPVDESHFTGEYTVRNATSRSTYKVVMRGLLSPWNYCSCMDFRASRLGTCKHLEAVKTFASLRRRKPHLYEPSYSSVYLDYNEDRKVRIRLGDDHRDELSALAKKYFNKNNILKESAYSKFDAFLRKAKAIDDGFRCYDDALDFIIEKREKISRAKMLEVKYTDEVLDKLLCSTLYPYQKEGVRFAIRAGKAIIADEMGLGKTIQAIAAAQIYLNEGLAENILIVCPTTLKYQWKKEIERFTGGDEVSLEDRQIPKITVVEGTATKREKLYKSPSPFKIVSYHTLANDVKQAGHLECDVLIMDEIQRLKNWNTQISKAARKVESRYSVLLSGTPLENKLEELFATMELVDQFCLGPYYRFRQNHILLNPVTGAVEGYKDLNAVGKKISDKLIRRTKKGVQLQLPKRSDEYILVPMTGKQADMHAEFRSDLSMILRKYEKYHFMTEKDRKRMMLLLAQMRMVSDSTFILDPNLETRSDIKIDEVMNILDNIFGNGDEKVVIFSEWERMARLVAIELDKRGIRFEYLNGSIPARQRGEIVNNFTTLPESRVFISTDAGSTGLNLQVASILINLDLPWNPAVLEQRIARIYRLGQEKNVQIIDLVSKDSIEEGMIGKLKFKTSMFEGVLDGGADTVFVNEDKFKQFMNDISGVMSRTAPSVEYVDEEVPESDSNTVTDENEYADASEASADAQVEHSGREAKSGDGKASVSAEAPDKSGHTASSDNRSVSSAESEWGSSPADEYTSASGEEASSTGEGTPAVDATQPQEGGNTLDADATQPQEGNDTLTDVKPAASASTGLETSSPRTDTNNAADNTQETEPQELVKEGLSFFRGLTKTLSSPEQTRKLVDSIVEIDSRSGKANIKIPVESKDSVMQLFSLIGKLMR